MGTVAVTTFSSDTETVTRAKLNGLAANLVTEFNGSIDNANIKAAAGIVGSKLNLAEPGAIGGTTPAAGAFTTLSASGTLTSTNFRKMATFGTLAIWISDGTTAEGALTGVEGDICLNGGTGAGQMAFCDAAGTNWTDM